MTKKIKYTFFCIIIFLIADFFLSNTYFFLLNLAKAYEREKRAYYGVKHDVFHHHLRTNHVYQEIFNNGKVTVKTNSLGFRDKDFRSIKYNKENKRVVFIGDSFTFGTFSNYEDTYVGMIEDELEKLEKIQVLNMGVASYSPLIYYHKVKFFLEKKLQFDHLVVFIDISDIEDEAIYYYYDQNLNSVLSSQFNSLDESNKFYKDIQKFFFTRSFNNTFFVTSNGYKIFVNFYKKNIILSDKKNIKNSNINEDKKNDSKINLLPPGPESSLDDYIDYIVSDKFKRDKWTIDERVYEQYEIGLKNSLNNMLNLSLLCKNNDIKLTVVVYPLISQIFYKDLESKQVKIWEKFSKENDVDFINLFPAFIDLKDDKVQILYKIKKYFIPYDTHYNKEGNRQAATFFLKKFKP
jgi:hypothetical protein